MVTSSYRFATVMKQWKEEQREGKTANKRSRGKEKNVTRKYLRKTGREEYYRRKARNLAAKCRKEKLKRSQ